MGIGLNRVELGMLLSAQDDGLETALKAALEQVDALREGMEALAEVEDPLAPFLASLEAMRTPLDGAVQQLADLKAAMEDLGGAGGLKLTVDDQSALATMDGLLKQEQAIRDAMAQAVNVDVNTAQAKAEMDQVTADAEAMRTAVDAAAAPNVQDAEGLAALQRVTADAEAMRRAVIEPMAPVLQDAEALSGLNVVRKQADADRKAMQTPIDLFLDDAQAMAGLEAVQKQQAADREAMETPIALTVDDAKALENLQAVREDFDADLKAMETPITPKVDTDPAVTALDNLKTVSASVTTNIENLFSQMATDLEASFARATAAVEADMQAMRDAMGSAGGTATTAGVALPGVVAGAGGVPSILDQAAAQGISAQEIIAAGYGNLLPKGAGGVVSLGGSTSGGSFTPEDMAAMEQQASQMSAEMQAMQQENIKALADMKAMQGQQATTAEEIANAEKSGGGGFLGMGGGVMGIAMNAFMAQQGLQMLMGSAMGTVSLQQLVQQTGMPISGAEQLMGELGTVGLGPSQAFSTLGQFESSLKSALTVTGSGGLGHEALLAIGAAGQASGLSIGGNSAQAVAQNIAAQLPTLGVQQQLETVARIYQGMVGNDAGMASIQTMFSGLGMGGDQLQNLVANLPEIQQQFQGYTIPGLFTAQQIGQASSSSLDMAANMSKLDLALMSMATTTAPALTTALGDITKAADPIVAVMGAINQAAAGIPALFQHMDQAVMPGIMEALDEAKVMQTQMSGMLAVGLGQLLQHLPGFLGGGPAATSMVQGGTQNLAESQFLSGALGLYGSNVPIGALHPMAPFSAQAAGGNTIQVTINVPGGTSASTQAQMQRLAATIVSQLRLAANIELTG